MPENIYQQHRAAQDFLDAFSAEKKGGAAFDDASSVWTGAPDEVRELTDIMGADLDKAVQKTVYASGRALLAAAMDSAAKQFAKEHGRPMGGAVFDSAIRNALNSISKAHLQKAGVPVDATMDNVSSTASGGALIANRAVVAFYESAVDIIPFAGLIPMSDGMKGQILVVQHEAASKAGAYQPNQSLDGILGGRPFMSAVRSVKAEGNLTTHTAKITYADGDSEGSPVLSSGLEVYVNGFPAGGVPTDTPRGEAQAQISGSVVLPNGSGGEQRHTVSGSLTAATGDVSLTFNPALPSGATVFVNGILDYEHEKMKDKRPMVQTSVRSYVFRAEFASGISRLTPEARTQLAVEARLDAEAEGMQVLRQQHAAEKHRFALQSMYRVAENFKQTVNMNAPTRQDERDRVSMWKDVFFALTQADVEMLERTNAFGIGVLYVGAKGRAELSALPEEIFQRSGIPTRPGIYRLGRLFGQFEVYYAPQLLKETANSIEMLAIGRSDQVGLNPYVTGDVVGATFMRLGVDANLREGAGYFYAGAARVNPHQKAACGAALIAVTGL